MFGKTKAKDVYQQIAMDSLIRNKLTLLKGPAGSGKSYLSLTYLFDRL
jgi:predicted ribonuclease YlaK